MRIILTLAADVGPSSPDPSGAAKRVSVGSVGAWERMPMTFVPHRRSGPCFSVSGFMRIRVTRDSRSVRSTMVWGGSRAAWGVAVVLVVCSGCPSEPLSSSPPSSPSSPPPACAGRAPCPETCSAFSCAPPACSDDGDCRIIFGVTGAPCSTVDDCTDDPLAGAAGCLDTSPPQCVELVDTCCLGTNPDCVVDIGVAADGGGVGLCTYPGQCVEGVCAWRVPPPPGGVIF